MLDIRCLIVERKMAKLNLLLKGIAVFNNKLIGFSNPLCFLIGGRNGQNIS